jgi:hypothetical protein
VRFGFDAMMNRYERLYRSHNELGRVLFRSAEVQLAPGLLCRH